MAQRRRRWAFSRLFSGVAVATATYRSWFLADGSATLYSRWVALRFLLLLLALVGGRSFAEPLTLERAVELVRQRNERAQIAHAESDAAIARVAGARSFFFPRLTLSGTYTRNPSELVRGTGDTEIITQRLNGLTANGALSLAIFDARSIPLYRSAVALADAARLDFVDATRLLSFEAADAFFQTLALTQVQEAAMRRLDLAGKSLDDARTRFQAQLVSSNDVTKAELDAANAQRALIIARNDLVRARLQLGLLLDIDAPLELVDPANIEPAQGDAASLVEQAQSLRPDILALDARTRSARFLAQEPLMRLVPNLNLHAQVRATNTPGLGRALDGNVGVTLTWVLFDGGERYADRDEQLALSRIADLDKRFAQREAAMQVKAALSDIESAGAAVKQSEIALRAAQKNASEVAELYRQGLASALDAQNARVQLFEAEVALVQSKYDKYLTTLDLRAALGLDALGRAEESK